MNPSRRRFLFGAAALVALSPAIVQAASLMALSTRNPHLWGDGIHDDTAALQRMIDRTPAAGRLLLPAGTYSLSTALTFPKQIDLDCGGAWMLGPPVGCAFYLDKRSDGSAIRNAKVQGRAVGHFSAIIAPLPAPTPSLLLPR